MTNKIEKRRCMFAFLLLWIVCILIYTLTNVFVGNDGFWHMAMGRQIVESGFVPNTAVGAWGGDSLPWIPQEWLYQLGIYMIFRNDMFLLSLFTMCLISFEVLLIGLLSGVYKDIFRKPWAVCLYVLVGMFSMLSFVVPRPQSVSLLCMIVFVYRLRKMLLSDNVKIQDYIIFALIGLFWANVHAGTVILGYLIPIGIAICYMVTDNFSVFREYFDVEHTNNATNHISWVACIMAGACFCTPNGISGFLYPVQSMGDELMLSVITEWAQPNVNDVMGLVMYYIPFLLFYGWLFFSKQKVKVYDFAVISFLFVLAILHVRLVLYLLPVLALLWIPYLSVYQQGGFKRCVKSVWTVSLSCLFLFLIICNVSAMSQKSFVSEGYGKTEFFDVVRDNCGERLYNYYDVGSILQYYDIPVFVDARYDPFSKERMPDFVQTQYLDSQSVKLDEIMQKYDFTSVLDLSESSVILYAKNHGFEKLAEWDTGVSVVDKSGTEVKQIYEFWVKK